ncbi:MAG TPA: S53 family peptidase [Candidatus Dormibacteraeota bacterium]|jgi:kumamolisin
MPAGRAAFATAFAAALALTAACTQASIPVATLTNLLPALGDAFPALIANSTDLGRVEPGRPVELALTLRDPSRSRRQARLRASYTPGDPDFGMAMSAQEYDARFGPDPAETGELIKLLTTEGVTAHWRQGDTFLAVAAPAARIDALFHTEVHDYRARSGSRFYASPRDPEIPAQLRPGVEGATHVSDYAAVKPHNVPAGGLQPTDLATAYDYKPLRDAKLDGTGETVVFMELDSFDEQDLDTFNEHFKLPPIQPPVKAGPTDLKPLGETIMDLEVVHAIAPGATLLIYNQNTSFNATWLSRTSAMVDANPGAIISISIGGCEPASSQAFSDAEGALYDKAAQLGETVFVASGDSGSFGCLNTDYGAKPTDRYVGASTPAVHPGVTAVGGTRLSVRKDSTWLGEQVWEEPPATVGSGGGVSAYIAAPDWQQAPGVDNRFNPNRKRQIPDISADADAATGMAIYDSGAWFQGGGTSQSAPIWAGITALINQYLRQQKLKPVGFLNPALYALASGKPPFPPFHDVTLGGNLSFPATPGYDLATGLGTPQSWNLARDLAAYQRQQGRI